MSTWIPDVREVPAVLSHLTAAMRGRFYVCWRKRKQGHPYCARCFYRLPKQLRRSIYAADAAVQEAARQTARAWLREHSR